MAQYNYKLKLMSAAASNGTGTISVGAAGTAVTGSGTAFLTQLAVGDVIISEGQTLAVASIANDTGLTLQSAVGAAISGAAFTYYSLVNVETFDTTRILAPKSTYRPYTEAVQLANGKLRGLGRPIAEWQWGFITRTFRDAIRVYCVAKSDAVYVRTRINESADAYKTFTGTIVWPDDEDKQTGRRVNFKIEFKNLVQL